MVQQISKEFIASFKDTECNNVVVSHILHDISSQAFCPGGKNKHNSYKNVLFIFICPYIK